MTADGPEELEEVRLSLPLSLSLSPSLCPFSLSLSLFLLLTLFLTLSRILSLWKNKGDLNQWWSAHALEELEEMRLSLSPSLSLARSLSLSLVPSLALSLMHSWSSQRHVSILPTLKG